MKNIEILLVDEKQLPKMDFCGIFATPNYFYLQMEEDSEAECEQFNIKKIGEFYDKKLIKIGEAYGDAVTIGDDFFSLDDYNLNHFLGDKIIKTVEPDVFSGHKNFEFADIGTDGKFLYIDTSKRKSFMLLDKDFNILSKVKQEDGAYYFSSEGAFFISNDDESNTYKKYVNGKLEKELVLSNSLCRLDLLYKIVELSLNPDSSEDWKIKKEINENPYPFHSFSGGGGIYSLMSNGHIFYPTENGSIDLGNDWMQNEDEGGGTTYTSKYAILFSNNKAGVFADGKIVGQVDLPIKTEKIRGLSSDGKFVYALLKGDILQRYIILE